MDIIFDIIVGCVISYNLIVKNKKDGNLEPLFETNNAPTN